ncbi:MAG: efflux RND transporter periplasmic adaptor subunit [Candidatus Nomurabacteria bacterium]|nr:efflux RND transporter periplasmic adaptor subunit [Candidatus Nomurabacteria bacterium]
MDKFKNTFEKVKNLIIKKKKISIIILIVLVVVSFFVFRSNKTNTLNIFTVKYTDLKQSVRATGQVISNTDLNLSFNKGGVVKGVSVAVGDTVKAGQVLAHLDQGEALATLTQARGSLMSAQAKYGTGSTAGGTALSEVSFSSAEIDLENVKKAQDILVNNAYNTLLNSTIEAVPEDSSNDYVNPVISGTYSLGKEGTLNIKNYQSVNGYSFDLSGLTTGTGSLNYNTPQPLGNSGLYIKLPSDSSNSSVVDWKIVIPNTHAVDYLKNYNAYQDALKNRDIAVSNAEANLSQKKAELSVGGAEIVFAQGVLQSAEAAYENTVIRAPADGTITRVDIKYGELAEAGKSVITIEDIKNLYIEALINEANIAYLKLGQNVDITFDAFGNDKKFTGVIAQIDPSAQTNNGVVNYKIKVSINEQNEIIRPGMNANINVDAGGKTHVIAIPAVALIKKDGKNFVDIVKNDNSESNEQRELHIGFVGDNNLVEITSGLNENEQIALTVN